MKQMLAGAALVFLSLASNAAENLPDAAIVEQQIKTCRLVLAREGVASGGMRLCMTTLFVYSKDRDLDYCRVFAEETAPLDKLQRCAASIRALRQSAQPGGNR